MWTRLCLALALLPALCAPSLSQGNPAGQKKKPRVSAEERAALEERLREQRTRQTDEHFAICDLDESESISFREAREKLGIDRPEYRLYDLDGDGRWSAAEFGKRYERLFELFGIVPQPRGEGGEPRSEDPEIRPSTYPARTSRTFPHGAPPPTQLLAAYDRDSTSGLSRAELDLLFTDIGAVLSSDVIVRQMDRDASNELETEELGPVALLVAEYTPPPRAQDDANTERLLRRLYRGTEPRPTTDAATAAPPWIPGPVTNFRRLDLWDDGLIDAEDLRQLMSPMRLNVRPDPVIAAIDRNGDGMLSESEFGLAFIRE